MTRAWRAAALSSLLALAGCCQPDHASADPISFDLDQPFVLAGGQEASINGEGLHVRFTDVLEDSRCPQRVECFWTGQARVAVLVQPEGHGPTTIEFNTNPAPGQTISTGRVDSYTVALTSLDPYPQTPDDATALEDYRATLAVTKG